MEIDSKSASGLIQGRFALAKGASNWTTAALTWSPMLKWHLACGVVKLILLRDVYGTPTAGTRQGHEGQEGVFAREMVQQSGFLPKLS